MPLTDRQKLIADIVKNNAPITGDKIAEKLNVTRAALRSDLAILTMAGLIDARTKVGYFYVGKYSVNMLADEVKSVLVKDVQSVPIAVDGGSNAYDTLVTMFTEDVGSVFVVEKSDILIGIVSRKDLLKASLNSEKLEHVPVKMVMTPLSKLIVTYVNEPIVLAAKKIIENEVDCLPVVQDFAGEKKKYKVVGRLTKTNITRLLVDLAEGEGGVNNS